MDRISKNPNEFWRDDKLYIKKIKSCVCREKIGEEYRLDCKIMQRGEHYYSYKKGSDYIKKSPEKLLWLDLGAKEKIEKEISLFDEEIANVKNKSLQISISEIDLDIYLEGDVFYGYDMLVIKNSSPKYINIYKDCNVEKLVKSLTCNVGLPKEHNEILKSLFDSNTETIEKNPLYIAARKKGDEALMKQLKVYYHIDTKEDCSWLTKLFGLRILPRLSKNYDRNYYVDADTINVSILDRSGYTVLHRPYFSMMNSTHSVWTLNPYTKKGVDAAKVDDEAISFSDFLSLFEEEKQ